MGLLAMSETYLSVKIREDVYRMVKTIAAWRGEHVGECLSKLVEPIAKKEMAKLSKEAGPKEKGTE